jgi:hypothetical protein
LVKELKGIGRGRGDKLLAPVNYTHAKLSQEHVQSKVLVNGLYDTQNYLFYYQSSLSNPSIYHLLGKKSN